MQRSSLFVSSTLLWSFPPEKWFSLAAEEGLSGVEVWAAHMDFMGISPETVKDLAARYGLTVTVHSYSWDINQIALIPAMKAAAVAVTKRAISMAAFLQSPQITIHPGREILPIPGVDYDRLLAESAEELGAFARKEGTVASFEIMEKIPKERLTSPEAIARMEAKVNGAVTWKYTEDIAHCDSREEIFHTARVLEGRIGEFHLSNKKGTKRHVPDAAEGDFDLPSVVDALSIYERPFILEGFDPSPEGKVFYNTLAYLDKGAKTK